jgi:tetratricopeptide (TPR) repeat protein
MMKLTAFSFVWLLTISVASSAQSAMISQGARIQHRSPENLYVQRRMPTPNPAVQDAIMRDSARRQREAEAWDRDPRNPLNQDPELRTLKTALELVNFYEKRAVENFNKKDFARALSYIDRAINVCNVCAGLYAIRGETKHALLDLTGAMVDFDLSIRLRKVASTYHNRGYLKRDMNDLAGAIDDFSTSIAMKPDPTSYLQRARTKQKLNDQAGAIQDYRQAARMYEQKGNTELYQVTVNELKAMNATL